MNALHAEVLGIFREKIKGRESLNYADHKDSVLAKRCLVKGTNLYKQGRHRESILFYTQSISAVPMDSAELCSAYYDRSGPLFELEEYDACLLDLNRAVKGNCPESLKKMSRKRKMTCMAYRHKQAIDKKITAPKINTNATDPADLIGVGHLSATERRVFVSEKVFDKQNPLLPGTSSKVELVYDEKKKSRMVAKEDILRGDFLSIEEMFVMRLDYEKRFYHCANCFEASVRQ